MAIEILSQDVVNQISAGEVVERPAHLIKELVENSVDAEATRVEVEVDLGGRRVSVKDNGQGIAANDLHLALARHATSKINTSADLWTLKSFGFRGEALASIAAVSHLELVSQTRQQEMAHKLVGQFGSIKDLGEVGGQIGTTITVDNLFENVPARLKFLKSDSAEVSQIKNVLKALALAHPHVEFLLKVSGKMIYLWPAQESKFERARQVLENDELFFESYELDGFKAEVAYSSPNKTQGNSRNIWLLVQNRWVQDRSLQTAVLEAYRNLLMHGEFPIAAVWVECPPDQIDVNIHPTKSQVKFVDAKTAFRVVNRALRQGLEKAPWLQDFLGATSTGRALSNYSLDSVSSSENQSFQTPEFFKVQQSRPKFFTTNQTQPSWALSDATYSYQAEGMTNIQAGVNVSPANVFDAHPKQVTAQAKWSSLEVLGQAQLTYILTQNDLNLIIIDQHAAHERVLFERFRENQKAGSWEIQNFLVPYSLNLSAEQVEALLSAQEELQGFGFQVENLGPDQLAVVSAPSQIKDQAIENTLQLFASEILDVGDSFKIEKKVSDVIASMACHSAIRAGQALTIEQMQSLLQQMDEFALSSFCPHGRPVYVEYPFAKMEKDFGRLL